MFVWMILSEPQNIYIYINFITKLVMVMHHYNLEFHAENFFAIFKVIVRARVHDQNMISSTLSFELLILLEPDLV